MKKKKVTVIVGPFPLRGKLADLKEGFITQKLQVTSASTEVCRKQQHVTE